MSSWDSSQSGAVDACGGASGVTGRSGLCHEFDLVVENSRKETLCFLFDEEFDEFDELRMLAVGIDANVVQVIIADRIKPDVLERIERVGTYLFELECGKQVIVNLPFGVAESGAYSETVESALEMARNIVK